MQIKEIFMIRCISCLSVVLLHIISMVLMLQAEALADISHTVDSLRTLLMFSTPAFIFISEFLLARSYPDGVPEGFLKKRGKVIFIPFLFIAAIDALLMASAMGGKLTFLAFVQKYLENVFLGNFIGYFILVIFQFYILHMLFHEYLKKASPKWVLSVSFVVTAAYLGYFSADSPAPASEQGGSFPFFWVPFAGWLFYFCLAYYCGKEYKRFLALLNQYRWVVYGAAVGSAALVVAVSYFGEVGMISSKRPDIMLYSTSMIFLCFHLFSNIKQVPKIIMFISNYSFSIYLLHAYFMIIGYVLLLNMPDIPAVPAVFLLFAVCTAGPILTSWALNKFKYGYLFVGKIYQPKRRKVKMEVRDHAG
ncbi:acyltransferase family protein [Bacillus halotolerans]|uniref:acyltransferase family protein n=1 Tax=Bacillus halotolerans TaxID=260554 RepID=UPI0018F1E54A|nr:acyltransferase family protein [Bacillus halotolerans]MBJ7573333.1 acyltransferase family protein [Bacillus halotolerans]MBV5123875.1 acyltransferase family protein [Bacillus halotolerans]MCC2117258.1 acyltransferase family protein [Bacillus halotolerans]